MDTVELTQRYFKSVRERDIDAFMALFEPDAVMDMPDGRQIVGWDAIRESELHVFSSANPPTPTPAAHIAGEDCIAVEIEIATADGVRRRMGSFFYFSANSRIRRLSIYRKG